MYIYQQMGWPRFNFSQDAVASVLEACHIAQGRLLTKMEQLGLSERNDKILLTITKDIIKSSEIEGHILNHEQVRSSVARRLGMEMAGLVSSSRDTEAVVEMMLDATQNYQKPLTRVRLFGWHSCLFPTGYSGLYKVDVGTYRQHPVQVVSGAIGHEKIHYEAPAAERIPSEMEAFLRWVYAPLGDGFIKSDLAHLWFVTLHPFDDGNGRIARTISDMLLCQSDKTSYRFYSMSNQIVVERSEYYTILERTQKGSLDVTQWIEWFLHCVFKAICSSEQQTDAVLKKYSFLRSIEHVPLNERQRMMLTRLVSDTWFGTLTSSKWAKIAKCSSDTALRDIQDLLQKGLLQKEPTSGGRSTNYKLLG